MVEGAPKSRPRNLFLDQAQTRVTSWEATRVRGACRYQGCGQRVSSSLRYSPQGEILKLNGTVSNKYVAALSEDYPSSGNRKHKD